MVCNCIVHLGIVSWWVHMLLGAHVCHFLSHDISKIWIFIRKESLATSPMPSLAFLAVRFPFCEHSTSPSFQIKISCVHVSWWQNWEVISKSGTAARPDISFALANCIGIDAATFSYVAASHGSSRLGRGSIVFAWFTLCSLWHSLLHHKRNEKRGREAASYGYLWPRKPSFVNQKLRELQNV